MLELLLELGASPNVPGRNGDTLLHIAVKKRDERAITAIVKSGGDPAVKNSEGLSPLDMATKISTEYAAMLTAPGKEEL
jgi:ankyrin repeat protein